ncbi:MAG: helix-turn-helix domain-containing protein [Acidobacteriota bacterium]|nr:helix-turn-helix domain-containing protein [Acidobacteriota bacterium]
MRDLLDKLIIEMVEKGVHYEDARMEFEKRFITKVIDDAAGNLCRAAETLGVHRNTLARRIKELKIRR